MAWVRGTVKEQTETAMTVQFEQATAEIEARFTAFLERESTYSALTNYLLYLSDRDTVHDSELTEVRVRLEQLGTDPGYRERSGFPLLLDLVARLAVRHGDLATLEFDDSALACVIQVSKPILDPATGKPIGAWTAAIDPSMLEDVL